MASRRESRRVRYVDDEDVTTAVKNASQSSQRAWVGLRDVVTVVTMWAAVSCAADSDAEEAVRKA